MQELKLSLVTSSGLLLAIKPDTEDEMKQILASGLISAIMTFAHEVHQSDLQSISYFDRTISFVQVFDYFFIIEVSTKEMSYSERQLKLILKQIKESAYAFLENRSSESLSSGEADLILEHCLHNLYNQQLIFKQKPLMISEPSKYTISLQENGSLSILEKLGSDKHLEFYLKLLKNNLSQIAKNNLLKILLILLPEEKNSAIVSILPKGETFQIGLLEFPPYIDYTVFRLFPLIKQNVHSFIKQTEEYDVLDILDVVQQTEDPGSRYWKINLEEISLTFLEKAIETNLSVAIESVVSGKSILVIGDKLTTKLIIDILIIFTQHLTYKINDWISKEEIKGIFSDSEYPQIIGLSSDVYEYLKKNYSLSPFATSINLFTGSADEGDSSTYFMDILEKSRNFDLELFCEKIFLELRKLVSMSFVLTSFTTEKREKQKEEIVKFLKESPFPESFNRKALKLASLCNFLLKKAVS
ncbi:MAG: hypothetical protein ACTSSF_12870 [Candidatus Heimdallarchaeaceae archaeon]